MSFECGDLLAADAIVRDHGGALLTEPLELDLPGVGAARAFAATGPDGEMIELFQRTGR